MHVVIVGGTGFIGRHLCRACREADFEVTVLARDVPRAESKLGASVNIAEWAPDRTPPPADVLNRCDAVVNLAGSPIGRRWRRKAQKAIRESRVRTTEQLVGRFGELDDPPKALLNASGAGYYGDRGDEELTEASQAGAGFLADLCCDWEAAASAAERFGVRVVLLRSGIVLGRRSVMLRPMLSAFRLGLGAVMGTGDQWMPWVHIADAIGLILHALRETAIEGPINVVAPGQVTNEDFTRALAAALHRRARLRIPKWLLKATFGGMSSLILDSQRVEPAVATRTNYTYRFPDIRDCLEDILAER